MSKSTLLGVTAAAVVTILAGVMVARGSLSSSSAASQSAAAAAYLVNDSHFHLTNYVQEGTPVRDFVKIMGSKVGRSTLFGIPLQQQWSYGNSGNFAPTYYL